MAATIVLLVSCLFLGAGIGVYVGSRLVLSELRDGLRKLVSEGQLDPTVIHVLNQTLLR